MSKNTCGDCTLCCELLPIPELGKPINTLCGNCTIKKGCNIYENRPNSCINFDCVYLSTEEMDEHLRPDNCNVIFERITTRIYLALCHYQDTEAYQSKPVMEHIQDLNEKGISVIASSFTKEPNEFFLAEGHKKEIVQRIVMNEYEKIK